MGFDNAAVARRYMQELFARGNADAIDELVDDSIELKDPMTPHGVRGKDAVRERIESMAGVFTDVDIIIEEVLVSGDRVVLRHTWRAKHVGTFMGVGGTGKYLSCLTSEFLRIRNGKVVENISYFDVYEMFQQLGLLPPPDQLAESSALRTPADVEPEELEETRAHPT